MHLIVRLLWAGVFFSCLGACVYLTVTTLADYLENPIQISIREEEPIYKFPFPATTITGTMILTNDALRDLKFMENEALAFAEFEYDGQPWNFELVDILIHTMDHICRLVSSFFTKENLIDTKANYRKAFAENQMSFDYMNVTLYDNKNDTRLKDKVFPVIKNKTLDCTKILAACYWEGDKGNCTEMFVPTLTDVGTGCSFNRIPEELLRKHTGLMSLLHDHEYTEKEKLEWGKFDIDSSISVKGMQDLYDITYPRSQHQAGKLTGLSVMLIFDENLAGMACPIVDSEGFLVGIHSPFEEPRIMQAGITVQPKTEVFVNVKTEAVFADPNIRSIAIAKRRCYFQDENPLKNFQFYTVANCHQECLGIAIQNNCSCSLLTQSVGMNERLCGPEDSDCVNKTTALLRREGYDRRCLDPVCYSPCTEIKYHADATHLQYREQKLLNFRLANAMIENAVTSIVHVTHGSNMISTRERKHRLSFSVLVGVIGGILGMMLDITLFSVFDTLAGLLAPCLPKCIHWERVIPSQGLTHESGNQSGGGTESNMEGNDLNARVSRMPDVEIPEPLCMLPLY